MSAIPDRVTEMFGGPEPLGRRPRTTDDWRELVEGGLSFGALAHLRQALARSAEERTG